MKTDKLFYEVFLEFPEIFFELIGANNVDARAYEFKAIELKETASRLDRTSAVRINGCRTDQKDARLDCNHHVVQICR